ncbi:MAG: mandelate racemase [Saprospiraceae bacterium]|nr:mandelate racemase [Saprospiraceae bacterium]
MKIKTILHKTVPIASAIRNAYIDFSRMDVSVVSVVSDIVRNGKPLIGYGFNSNGRYAQEGIIKTRLIPRLLESRESDLLTDDGRNFDPTKAWQIMMRNEKPGGHGERSVAVGVLDMAIWDLVAKIEDRPLYAVLADRFNAGLANRDVYVYAAGGYYYPGKDIEQLKAEMLSYLDLGYDTLKIKIGGASLSEDLERIKTVLKLVTNGQALAVDANGRFDLPLALEYAKALDDFNLKWYEEPGDPLDYDLNTMVCQASQTPIATGENLFSMQDARNLIRYGGMLKDRDYLQFDPALSYGLTEYLRTMEVLAKFGWSRKRCIPHGGHQFALQIAAGLGLGGNESYPHVFQPFGGFADNNPVENGKVRIPDAPGIGIELKKELLKVFPE